MFKVTFIRHGESLGNANEKYYQVPDAANILTPKGVDQSLALMEMIDTQLNSDFYQVHTTVIASEYQCAKLTAQIVMSRSKLRVPIIYDKRLNEIVHIVPIEDDISVKKRVLSLIEQYPFNLILFCHGMLMGVIDPAKGGAQNCELRSYDRAFLIDRLRFETK